MPICPISKSMSPFSAAPSFSKHAPTLRKMVNEQNGKRTYCRLPPLQGYALSYFHGFLRGLSLQNIFYIFSQTCVSHHGCGKFQIHGVKKILSQEKWICSFLLMSLSKTLPQVFVIATPGRRKLSISPEQRFLYFFPSRKGRGLWSRENDQN